ncbi:hypothetical protein ACIP93_20680 [Streptomyces sp. NPDC088745]|uniref:hypothetical protein n=1 Tax=Streptomyces sp. NPDC088745 TaxID=3365884 RepID=UPI003803BF5A
MPAAWRAWHRPLVVFSALMIASTVLTGIGLVADDRTVAGSPVWFKPFKFSVSFAAYGLSLAWMLSLLPKGRAGTAGRRAGTVVAAASAGEMVLILGQAARGRRSHFNLETAFDSAVFAAMGLTIVVLWVGSLVAAALLLRTRILERATSLAVKAGAVLALVGTGLGFLMTRPTPAQREAGITDTVGAHGVGVADGGPAMPVTGWATTGGDLRIPHFVGMHSLQLLPLLALLLLALAPRFTRFADPLVRLRLTAVACASYAALLGLVTWQALRGQALVRPDAMTLVAAAALAVATAAGVLLALRPGPARRGRSGRSDRELAA